MTRKGGGRAIRGEAISFRHLEWPNVLHKSVDYVGTGTLCLLSNRGGSGTNTGDRSAVVIPTSARRHTLPSWFLLNRVGSGTSIDDRIIYNLSVFEKKAS